MENGGLIVALILLALVGGANLLTFLAARGAFRGGDGNWMSAAQKSLRGATQQNGELEELRQRMAEMEKKKDAQENP